MPPRLRLFSSAVTTASRYCSRSRTPGQFSSLQCVAARRGGRSYSTEQQTEEHPLIRVTDFPAPNTGHIRVLELNRPSARNALSRALVKSLREEISQIAVQYDQATGEEVPTLSWNRRFGGAAGDNERGPTRALILASAVESCFCAGADLKERKGFTPEETKEFLESLRSTFTSLSELPIPTISAISSRALGGGLELALSTHFRVLTTNATVALPETRLGIIPGAGGTHRLPALIGIPRARDLIATGRVVSAPEAYFLGIADRLVEVEQEEEPPSLPENGEEKMSDKEKEARVLAEARRAALGHAVALAVEICQGGPVAVRAALKAVQNPSPENEDKMYKRILDTEDRVEALKAFAEKRKPVFQGK